MKDIDFDELDKAVSSLMSPPANDNVGTNSADEATAETPAVSLDAPVVTSENQLSETHEPETTEKAAAPTTTSIPAARRGRFMDVMHPSTRDMKKPSPVGPISRQGVTLQPTTAPTPAESPAAPEAPAEQPDMNTALEEAPTFGMDSLESEPIIENKEAEAESTEETPPLSSPFLPDAKVEKRPLGRPIEPVPAVDLAAALSEDAATMPVSELPVEGKDAQLPEQPIPPEFDSELLSVETSTENLPPETQPAAVPATAEQPAAAPVPEPVVSSTPAATMTSASIPQQYKLQPKQNEEAPASAIYDTQPLAHPAKKSSGLLWIVGIMAILLIGVGGGAAIYYLGLF